MILIALINGAHLRSIVLQWSERGAGGCAYQDIGPHRAGICSNEID